VESRYSSPHQRKSLCHTTFPSVTLLKDTHSLAWLMTMMPRVAAGFAVRWRSGRKKQDDGNRALCDQKRGGSG
jgi:hypothetical protein